MLRGFRFLLILSAGAASAANAQTAKAPPVAPPPPPVMTVPMPPLPISTMPGRPVEPVLFTVELIGAGERLWTGQLRLGQYNVSYNASINDSPEPCAADKSGRARYDNVNRNLNFSINRRGYSGTANEFQVSASWSRALPGCEAGTGSVSFQKTVKLEPGSTTELTGDAGFVVRLSRAK